ncbi:MAG TPA: DUF4153 domain-containing protein [Bacteroidia bacterium]|jgi:hypothetical protein|nr:DUF4153 domain-containing protein [Bacteroidia bacterium]
MAKFPSVKSLLSESTQTLFRFPMALLSAIAGSGVALYLSYLKYMDHEAQETGACLLMICSYGLTLFFSLSVFSERKNYSNTKKIIIQSVALVVLAGYYIYLRNYFIQIEFVRYALINVALHLLVSFAAYTGKNNLAGFWQFNKALFLRLFFAVIYSGTLYLGICLAMMAVDELFNVKIDGQNYFRLWIIIAGVFNTWFFLAGVPKNSEELNQSEEYPKGLKIFTQYVLLPLVTLYLLILYAYMGKILLSQNLPKGWVSYLVIGFSVAGILALLLIHPIRNKEGNNWIHIFSKWFYGALYPLVIMLFVAIGRRITDYGITENRYFIIVLAIWLAAVSTYFLFSKISNIKYIPISLCLIALLSSFGPWGAFSVSEKSQLTVLENILIRNEILKNGKIDNKHKEVADTIAEQITSIVRYFNEMHGFQKFKPWFNQNIDSLIADSVRWGRVTNILKLMNVQETYNYNYSRDENGVTTHYFSYYPEYEDSRVKEISGYDYEINFNANCYSGYNYDTKYNLGKDTFMFGITKDSLNLEVKKNGAVLHKLGFTGFIKIINDSCKKLNGYSSAVPVRFMESVYEDSTLKIKLQFNSLYGYTKNKKYKTNNAGGNCLIKLKSPAPR